MKGNKYGEEEGEDFIAELNDNFERENIIFVP